MSSKKLKIQLLERVSWLGNKWDIINVSHVYAINFLIPKKLARTITLEIEKWIQEKIEKHWKFKQNLKDHAQEIADKLHGKNIIFEIKWSSKKAFWSIKEEDIVNKIKKDFSITLDKKFILLPEEQHIKKAWLYDININLWSNDIYIKMTLELKLSK
jgi:large subunit ribosomal protein L9